MIDFSTETDINVLRAAGLLLVEENSKLRRRIAELEAKLGKKPNPKLEQELAVLKDLLDRREQEMFGPSSERRPNEREPIPKKPQRGHGPREQKQLKRVPIDHELPPEARHCPHCGAELVPLGDQVEESERINFLAREFILEIHRRKKYRCPCNGHVATAPGPLQLIPGGRYAPDVAVEVAANKYLYHLPLERQAQMMKHDGLQVDAHTLWDQINVLAKVASPTYEAILAAVLTAPVIHADETSWPVLKNGKTMEKKGWYVWCVANEKLVGYRILDGRGNNQGSVLLGNYAGVVMADGYEVYASLSKGSKPEPDKPPRFKVANCWAHVRRKFVESEANFPKESREAIDMIKDLYEIERRARDLSPEERQKLRTLESKPNVDALFAWADQQKALPRSGLGEALNYLRNQKPGLTLFLEDPAIPIDNNLGERVLRGVVLGRKNHYGSRSRRGTEVAAILYTLLESAKLAEVPPREYLQAVVEAGLRQPGTVLLPTDFKAELPKS